jgi:hypothetical protein
MSNPWTSREQFSSPPYNLPKNVKTNDGNTKGVLMKTVFVTFLAFFSIQSHAFKIECSSTNNLDVSQIDFESLKIESVPKGNWITINEKITKLGDSLPPVKKTIYERMTTRAGGFTVLSPLKLGSITFPAGSNLTYLQNKMELAKYRDTVVTFIDFSKGIEIDLDCEYRN